MSKDIVLVLRRFGDEHSTLFDRYERLSFEAHLNRAMLDRSLSAPAPSRLPDPPEAAPPVSPSPLADPLVMPQVHQGRRPSGSLSKIFKKLLKPILGRRKPNSAVRKQERADDHPFKWKSFSRSLRV